MDPNQFPPISHAKLQCLKRTQPVFTHIVTHSHSVSRQLSQFSSIQSRTTTVSLNSPTRKGFHLVKMPVNATIRITHSHCRLFRDGWLFLPLNRQNRVLLKPLAIQGHVEAGSNSKTRSERHCGHFQIFFANMASWAELVAGPRVFSLLGEATEAVPVQKPEHAVASPDSRDVGRLGIFGFR